MIEIIAATTETAPTLVDLGIRTFMETYGAHNTQADLQLYLKDHYSNTKITDEIMQPETWYFLALYNNKPAGFAKLRNVTQPELLPYSKNIEIERLYVLNEYQQKTIGTALIKHCLNAALQMGYEVAWLGVWQQNAKAVEFYEKAGFERFGKQSFLLGKDLQTDWLMKYNLKPAE